MLQFAVTCPGVAQGTLVLCGVVSYRDVIHKVRHSSLQNDVMQSTSCVSSVFVMFAAFPVVFVCLVGCVDHSASVYCMQF